MEEGRGINPSPFPPVTPDTQANLYIVLILLLRPESFPFLLSYFNLVIPAEFTKLKPLFTQESKTLKGSGCSSKMTSSCKWPITPWDCFEGRILTQFPLQPRNGQ